MSARGESRNGRGELGGAGGGTGRTSGITIGSVTTWSTSVTICTADGDSSESGIGCVAGGRTGTGGGERCGTAGSGGAEARPPMISRTRIAVGGDPVYTKVSLSPSSGTTSETSVPFTMHA